MIRYQRDQDDEPMLSNEESGAGGVMLDEYGQPIPSPNAQKQLTFEQQKAELKRKIMAQPAKRQKIKKQKKDTVYNPEGKLSFFFDNSETIVVVLQCIRMKLKKRLKIELNAKRRASYT